MSSSEEAAYIIKNNVFMVVATSDTSGKPWISTVGFTYDDAYNLYWVSSKEALHSNNVRNRPEVAITIFGQMPDGDFDGVYIDAKAVELSNEADIQIGIEMFTARRPQPSHFVTRSVSDVTGKAAWRMYKASPTEISKRADSVSNGQAITIREIVQL